MEGYLEGVSRDVSGGLSRRSLEGGSGIFDLKIIANNAILLVISISATFALLESCRVSNEAKNFKELEFLVLSR